MKIQFTCSAPAKDSAQAAHILEIIQKDTAARIVVLAGYGHIEKREGDDNFVPMAFQFRSISHIDPLCIDQTMLTEEGNEPFSKTLYDHLQKAYPVKQPAVLMKSGRLVNCIPDTSYDLTIIHPRSSYHGGRATWYSLNHDRKPVLVSQYPKNAFLVQAYYLKEWSEYPVSSPIPADQTYCKTQNRSYTLFLKKGKYKVVYRDMEYRILNTKSLNIP